MKRNSFFIVMALLFSMLVTKVPASNVTIGSGGQFTSTTLNIINPRPQVSLNVSPHNHIVADMIAAIAGSVLQIKGTDGVYIPGNPFSTLDQAQNKGAYTQIWDGRDMHNRKVASGVYFIRMNAGDYQKTIKTLITQ